MFFVEQIHMQNQKSQEALREEKMRIGLLFIVL